MRKKQRKDGKGERRNQEAKERKRKRGERRGERTTRNRAPIADANCDACGHGEDRDTGACEAGGAHADDRERGDRGVAGDDGVPGADGSNGAVCADGAARGAYAAGGGDDDSRVAAAKRAMLRGGLRSDHG